MAGRGCYIAPTRALCYEKYRELQELKLEARVVLGNKDYGLGDRLFRNSDFRIITPWKLNQFLTNVYSFDRFSPVVVIDEIHRLDPDIEIILTKLLLLYPEVKVVGLSATVHEDDEPKFAQWLQSVVVKSEDRPVPIIERVVHFEPDIKEEEVVCNVSVIEYGVGEVQRVQLDHDVFGFEHLVEIYKLIRDSGDEAPILIWTPYRKRAENIAYLFQDHFEAEEREINSELGAIADSLPESSDTSGILKRVIPYRIGIHHGGMSQRERELIYELTRAGKLEVIITCLTLAQGVNLPARHVIFETVYDYDETEQRRLIDVSLFRQIEGRAGRPQYDSIGYCWIPVFSEVEKAEVEEVLLKYKASKIESKLYNKFFLTSQVPGLILLGFNTPQKLIEFIKATFWGQALQDIQPLMEQFEQIISYLIDRKVTEPIAGRLILTEKGQKIARLGLHPEEYEAIEMLVQEKDLNYETWVRNIARVQIGPNPDERYTQALKEVVDYGLTIYTKGSNIKTRDLADYVQRIMDIAEAYFAVSRVDPGYRWNWREKVYQKFIYGNLILMEKLAPALNRDQVKRLVRNLGELLMKDTDELESDDLKQIAQTLYGHYRHFYPGKQTAEIAARLGISHAEWIQIIEEARKPKKNKSGSEPGEGGDQDD